jgi:DNA-binding PadR family transcriptional regulator
MALAPADNERIRRLLLLHLLEHHGQQVRFEASQWTTEFGIVRRFPDEDPLVLRATLRALEMARLVFQRSQYVVGYSEPKTVYSLTPSGHRQALEFRSHSDGRPPELDDHEVDGPGLDARSAPTG